MACNGVLVVEDEKDIRDCLQEVLEREGYQVATAANGKEGMELLPKVDPCVILLDLMMPVMNGWEFAEKIDKNKELSEAALVVVSAGGEHTFDIKAKKILRKPVDLDVLLATVKKYCQEH